MTALSADAIDAELDKLVEAPPAPREFCTVTLRQGATSQNDWCCSDDFEVAEDGTTTLKFKKKRIIYPAGSIWFVTVETK